MYSLYFLRRIRRRCMERFHSGVILLGGALMIIVIGAFEIKGGFGTIVSDAIANKKIISADNWKLNGSCCCNPYYLLRKYL